MYTMLILLLLLLSLLLLPLFSLLLLLLLHYVLSYLCVASAIRIHKYDHALSNVCKVCTYSDQIQDIKLIVIMNHHYKLIIRPLWLQVVFVLVTPFHWKRKEMNVSLVISALPIWLIEMVKQYYYQYYSQWTKIVLILPFYV